VNDGSIGYSSFAAMRREVTARVGNLCMGTIQWPLMARYRSKIETAKNNVSNLYSF